MTDRVPGNPGQYTAVITPAEFAKLQAGQSAVITLTRDDNPVVPGTPYNKASVLPDALAETLCPDIADPTPADALEALTERVSALEDRQNISMELVGTTLNITI